jgi:hypothetical protein
MQATFGLFARFSKKTVFAAAQAGLKQGMVE